jgi:uncharacterized protein (DUF1684 family)
VRRAITALTIATAASPPSLPLRFSRVQDGTWFCNTEPGGICIDGPEGKGRRYSFNIDKMTFKSPERRGRILRIDDGGGEIRGVILSDGSEFTFYPDRDGDAERFHVTLRHAPPPVRGDKSPALRCKP